jgi:hypothetical protein
MKNLVILCKKFYLIRKKIGDKFIFFISKNLNKWRFIFENDVKYVGINYLNYTEISLIINIC